MKNTHFLGNNSYPAIVGQIFDKIRNTQVDTLAGNEILTTTFVKLNESKTPILDLKEFITGAEKISGDDVKLKEILDFTKKSIVKGDLNFIINLCKEEHFVEMKRNYHPSPEQTVKEIESYFNEPSSVIEQGIKNGIFDNLKSNLLNKIKSDLNVKDLKESKIERKNNLVKYSPIGLVYEDAKNNRNILLLENNSLLFNKEFNTFEKLNENLELPQAYNNLITAINSCQYDIDTETFKLNENWDFELSLHKNGLVKVQNKNSSEQKIIKKEDVSKLLLESVNVYVENPTILGPINKVSYLKDADNFIALMENSDKLVKFDNIEIVRNLNENTFVGFDKDLIKNASTPKILFSSSKEGTFKTYSDMMEACAEILSDNISDLFEQQLINERNLISENNKKLSDLNEEQKVLNTKITNIRNVKKIAEPNSPALHKLNEQERTLDEALAKNINLIDFHQNQFTIY